MKHIFCGVNEEIGLSSQTSISMGKNKFRSLWNNVGDSWVSLCHWIVFKSSCVTSSWAWKTSSYQSQYITIKNQKQIIFLWCKPWYVLRGWIKWLCSFPSYRCFWQFVCTLFNVLWNERFTISATSRCSQWLLASCRCSVHCQLFRGTGKWCIFKPFFYLQLDHNEISPAYLWSSFRTT